MDIRGRFATVIGKATCRLARALGRDGSSLPGKVASRIDPQILAKISEGYRIIIVTGTNGKTLTTSLITAIMRTISPHVLTNPTGANMKQGIVSSFVMDTAAPKTGEKFAVLEVDEASLKHVTQDLQAEAVVFTNVFRDQMDRYAEIYTTLKMMVDGARLCPQATIIANGDLPLFHDFDLDNPVTYFGFAHESDGDTTAPHNSDGVLCPHCDRVLRYRYHIYANLGKYYCPHCDFKRPDLRYELTQINQLSIDKTVFTIDDVEIEVPIGGLYNVYNALAAYSVGRHFGVAPHQIKQAISQAPGIFGRQERINVGEHRVTFNLIKNPVGFNQIVSLLSLEQRPFHLVALLNDNYADGTDVSWIWDGDFEQLVAAHPKMPVVISGTRADELALRFKVAGLADKDMLVEHELSNLAARILDFEHQQVHVLATYTAMLELRRVLASQDYMDGSMRR